MTGQQIRSAQIALQRAIEAEDYTTAEELALMLAPHVDARCAALDADPARKTQAWGTDA
jgi:hypothetical protein